jgi:hypothetical protein
MPVQRRLPKRRQTGQIRLLPIDQHVYNQTVVALQMREQLPQRGQPKLFGLNGLVINNHCHADSLRLRPHIRFIGRWCDKS